MHHSKNSLDGNQSARCLGKQIEIIWTVWTRKMRGRH